MEKEKIGILANAFLDETHKLGDFVTEQSKILEEFGKLDPEQLRASSIKVSKILMDMKTTLAKMEVYKNIIVCLSDTMEWNRLG